MNSVLICKVKVVYVNTVILGLTLDVILVMEGMVLVSHRILIQVIVVHVIYSVKEHRVKSVVLVKGVVQLDIQ